VVQQAVVRQEHIGHGASISVPAHGNDRHGLAKGERELLGLRAERLALLGAVDAVQADLLAAAVVKNGDAVAVGDAEVLAGELCGLDRMWNCKEDYPEQELDTDEASGFPSEAIAQNFTSSLPISRIDQPMRFLRWDSMWFKAFGSSTAKTPPKRWPRCSMRSVRRDGIVP